MSHFAQRTSYFALRVCPRADAELWWSAVRRRDDIPSAIAALLRGRARIELSGDEARHALAWAGGIEGWGDAEARPLFIYPANPVGDLASTEIA